MEEDAHRPAVADDMMHVQQEQKVHPTTLHQGDADQRPRSEMKRLTRLLTDQCLRYCLALLLAQPPEIDDRQREFEMRNNDLVRLPVVLRKCRSQHLMPTHDLIDTPFK